MNTGTPCKALLPAALLCSILNGADAPPSVAGTESTPKSVTNRTRKDVDSAAEPGSADKQGVGSPNAARTVHYGERDVVMVMARLRFTTLIVLPASMLKVTSGRPQKVSTDRICRRPCASACWIVPGRSGW